PPAPPRGGPGARRLGPAATPDPLPTQYLEEADQLAHRISVVDHGRVIADGTADELKSKIGGDRIDVVVRDAAQLEDVARLLPGDAALDADRRLASAPVADRMEALTGVVQALRAAGIEAEDIAVRRPTLDEVFLRLTGRTEDQERMKEAV
ncbi:DUF4162 domain-containing protein, partial [Streptomyces sp. NPDC059037]|uniref:ATP-binding protein DrrA1-3 family domain-containing protein n=1 Tax=Streptomyces sp. NPDC059037 TaxID=3346710 RepID=UPI00367EFF16